MNEQSATPEPVSHDDQQPHVPGGDDAGDAVPREVTSQAGVPASGAPDDAGRGDGEAPVDDDSPLGGDETTEEQLTADTAVERDALKSLDPDDTPA